MSPCLTTDPLETLIQMCMGNGNIAVRSCKARAPCCDPQQLVLEGMLALAMLALRSSVLSCSHRPAEGQGARGFHHPRQPLLPGSLRPRHESGFSASYRHAAEQERYCVPFFIPRRDAFHCSAGASRQLGLLSRACPCVCADVAGSLPPSPSLPGHREAPDTLCPELLRAWGHLHLGHWHGETGTASPAHQHHGGAWLGVDPVQRAGFEEGVWSGGDAFLSRSSGFPVGLQGWRRRRVALV